MRASIVTLGKAIGDQARATMLSALMSGKALTATELAAVADIMPSTASSHLQKLVELQLLVVCKQGRHRYFQLADAEVAELLESMMTITTPLGIETGPKDPHWRQARVCYDHLAGQMGVQLLDSLKQKTYIDDTYQSLIITEPGKAFFAELGLDTTTLPKRRPLCRHCLDWSERRHHLAGSLGAWLLGFIRAQHWVSQQHDSRILIFSDKGREKFTHLFLT